MTNAGKGGSYILNPKTGERTLVHRTIQEDKTNLEVQAEKVAVDEKPKKK